MIVRYQRANGNSQNVLRLRLTSFLFLSVGQSDSYWLSPKSRDAEICSSLMGGIPKLMAKDITPGKDNELRPIMQSIMTIYLFISVVTE